MYKFVWGYAEQTNLHMAVACSFAGQGIDPKINFFLDLNSALLFPDANIIFTICLLADLKLFTYKSD